MPLAAGLLIATVIDLRTRRIPNAVTVPLATLGLALAAAGLTGLSPRASLAGAVLGVALMLPGHLLGATGAGDVKLMGAAGALLGPDLIVRAYLFTALAGGVLALAVALRRRQLAAAVDGAAQMVAMSSAAPRHLAAARPARRFAYGPAIAAGSLLAAFLG